MLKRVFPTFFLPTIASSPIHSIRLSCCNVSACSIVISAKIGDSISLDLGDNIVRDYRISAILTNHSKFFNILNFSSCVPNKYKIKANINAVEQAIVMQVKKFLT